MNKTNILLLSAGRRVELAQEIKISLNKYLPDSKLYAVDLFPSLSPACHVAYKSYKSPPVTDAFYMDFLLKICESENIGMIIPTIDTELIPLAKNIKRFSNIGTKLISSDLDFISKCRNKYKTQDIYKDLDIPQPKIYNLKNIEFPCFCKPYNGSCSIGAKVIENEKMLTDDIVNNPDNMFMELIKNDFDEYTVDAYYNRDNNLRALVPRKRIEVRSGEVSKGVTKKNYVYDFLLERVSYIKGAIGCITFQFFANPDTKEIKALEINPRFGGGYPLTHSSGAVFTDWLVEEYLLSRSIYFYDNWEKNLLMLRYDAKVLIHENKS